MNDMLLLLINQTKEEIEKDYKTEDLTDLCDVTCERLSKKLKQKGFSGKIISGKVFQKWLSGETFEYIHYWIKVGETIIDPTNSQFGFKKNVFNENDSLYSLYEFINDVKQF